MRKLMTNEKTNPEIIGHDYEVHSNCTLTMYNVPNGSEQSKKQQPHEQWIHKNHTKNIKMMMHWNEWKSPHT